MIKSFAWRKKGCIFKHFYQWNLDLDKNRIADSLNKYFTSSATRLLESVWTSCGFNAIPTPSRHYPDFNFAEVSEAYVRSQLRGLKPGKAVGLDNIPARLLIDSGDIVAKPLTAIINSSLQSGVVPSEWKAVSIIPLFQKGRRYGQLSSYFCSAGCF